MPRILRWRFTLEEMTPLWRAGRRSDQFALALLDPEYLGLRSGRAMVGISCCLPLEKQIQTNETIHDALTNRRMAARIRSPFSPAATQTAFRVTILQTPSVSTVETTILLTFLSVKTFTRDGMSAMLCGVGTCTAELARFLAILVSRRNAFLANDKHNLNQRPMALPMASAPKYSSQSNQRAINVAILTMATLAHFRRGCQIRARTDQQNERGWMSVDRHFVRLDLNRQQRNPVLAQDLLLLCDEIFVIGRLQSRSQAFQTLL